MVSSGWGWNYLINLLVYNTPTLIVWGVAVYLCFSRGRQNPKGVIYLGLAILTQLVASLTPFIYSLVFQELETFGATTVTARFRYVTFGISITSQVLMWILITMAVFTRPKHYDYVGGPAFDEDPAR